jgi:uncharacterized membrane protein YozB (DUF420 family)
LFSELIVLHAGVPLVVSQTSLTVMLVVLAMVFVGISFGLAKNKTAFLQHRFALTAAVALALIIVLSVMLPATFTFYTDPDLNFFSPLSAITIIHGVIGLPAIVLGLLYAFGDLPQKTKRWMRWTAVFWVLSVLIGVVLFLTMQDLISFSISM